MLSKFRLFTGLFLFARCTLWAISMPPNGSPIDVAPTITAMIVGGVGNTSTTSEGAKQITVTNATPDKSYSAQFAIPFPSDGRGIISKGEIIVALVKARVLGPVTGSMIGKLQIKTAPYTQLASMVSAPVAEQWTEYPLVFTATEDSSTGQASLQLLCGHQAQTIEIASVSLFKYPGGTDTSLFPRIPRTYPGRSSDAPWRKEALARVEAHRKSDLSLHLTGTGGQPLANTSVKVELRRHQFGFGSAVNAKRFTSSAATPDDVRYREIIDKYFSIVVFENDLKDGLWEPHYDDNRKKSRNAELDAAFAWLQERHIPVRGHYLMQVATPFNFNGVTDGNAIRDRVISSVKERLAFVKDRVCEWDVINHPIAWHGADMLNKIPGLDHLDEEVFTLARSLTKLPFFVNEDQVFRPGPQYDDTYLYIQRLKDKGFVVAGLGNQAHFDESYLPSPEHLLAVTDHFHKLVPHQAITEYDIVTSNDEELAADYTRDVLIATFSHPAYTSFLFWGFWEGAHWKPEAASWSKDWKPRKRAEAITDLIGKQWHTSGALTTDANGRIQWRGFPGWYQVTISGQTKLINLTTEEPKSTVTY